MSDNAPKKKETPFQTPNPTELKQAAKADPMQQDYLSSNEANVAELPNQNNEQSAPFMDNQNSEVRQENQTIRANISGH
ncbi:hypothetical protein ACQ4M3_28625 [Leptolyngbya sp. AN03gr2]|uniref:hypothetical protein n=1 Tax=unclassified Leptolyngbya TaxID=2650499 RepID=UPI003D3138BC